MSERAPRPAGPATAPDEFDAVLARTVASTSLDTAGAAPASSTPLEQRAMAAETGRHLGLPSTGTALVEDPHPTFADFVDGWELYRDPVLCGAAAGLALGALGVFIVLRRAVFVTAAVSQSAALGVAFASLAGVMLGWSLPPIALAFLFAMATTALLALPNARWQLPREASVGVLYVVTSALTVLVGDRIAQDSADVSALLFGTAVLVRPEDLLAVLLVSAAVVVALGVLYRGFVLAGFDPEGARVQGLPVRRLDVLLWALVALEVAVATRAIGALPVFAFSALPAMAALTVPGRLSRAVVIAAMLGALAGAAGYLFAFLARFPVGASQAALAGLSYAAVLAAVALGRASTSTLARKHGTAVTLPPAGASRGR